MEAFLVLAAAAPNGLPDYFILARSLATAVCYLRGCIER